ncbi:MAG: DUF4279 domain-containing protein [Sphingobacteriales bacterium]|nr:MAG: DUF4279 domain-containing protein [Sphingobacteriales bacterium]
MQINEAAIIDAAIKEIEAPEWGATEQLLKVHKVVYEGDKPKVLRVDMNSNVEHAIVYFPVVNKRFYFAMYVTKDAQLEARGLFTLAYHAVYLKVNSRELSFDELAAMTKLKSTGGWNKGDTIKNLKVPQRWSAFFVESNPEPDEFERKLDKLLSVLETDIEGLVTLKANATTWIQVASEMHNGNSMIGGYNLSAPLLKRLAALEIEIDFDICAAGNLFKEEDMEGL